MIIGGIDLLELTPRNGDTIIGDIGVFEFNRVEVILYRRYLCPRFQPHAGDILLERLI